jgi:hypothetical protein
MRSCYIAQSPSWRTTRYRPFAAAYSIYSQLSSISRCRRHAVVIGTQINMDKKRMNKLKAFMGLPLWLDKRLSLPGWGIGLSDVICNGWRRGQTSTSKEKFEPLILAFPVPKSSAFTRFVVTEMSIVLTVWHYVPCAMSQYSSLRQCHINELYPVMVR